MSNTSEWQRMRERAPFAPEAFRFVQEGLQHTLQKVRGGQADSDTTNTTVTMDEDVDVADLDMTLLGEIAGFDAHDLEEIAEAESRHVSGQELCLGLRSLAVEKYGLLARTVLRGWGVSTTEDFGKIVYAMVDTGLLRTSENDSLDDFRGVYEFEEAFDGLTDRCGDSSGAAGTDAVG